jgi:putative membrane protein insertion efficiency factor
MTLLAAPQLTAALIAEARAPGKAAAGSQLTTLVLAGIRTYQREISPRRAPCCHFTPSCSEYAAQALRSHGGRRGGWLAIKRLTRCRPGAPIAHDPVPPATDGA